MMKESKTYQFLKGHHKRDFNETNSKMNMHSGEEEAKGTNKSLAERQHGYYFSRLMKYTSTTAKTIQRVLDFHL